jgi:general secretion pathway protein D
LNDPESLRFRNLFSATTGFIKDPAAAGAANFAVSSINDAIDVDALLQALDSSSEAKLLADPSITVADRYEASIRIVQKIPIVAADPVENSGVVFSQVDFEEAGVILNVQPRISRDGTVELIVQPEYSVVVDFINNNPVIDSRTAQTTVRVADGQMFALGGLRQKTIVETVRGVPGLRNIKYIGKLFQAHDTEVRESELIVFLKPEVITPYSPGTLRQQHAGYVGTEQLDAIAHAESVPATPSCQDHHCPNHYPRPRLNGGSRSLEISLEMMGGSGMIPVEQYGAQDIEIVDEYSHETTEQIQQDNISQQAAPDRSPNVVIHEVYPPIHIDPRASQ